MIRKYDFGVRYPGSIRRSLPLHATDMMFEKRDLLGLGFMTEALRDAIRDWIIQENFLITERPIFDSFPEYGQPSLAESFEKFVQKNAFLGADLDRYIEWLERVDGIRDNTFEGNFGAWLAVLSFFACHPERLSGDAPSRELLRLLQVVREKVVEPDMQLRSLEEKLQPDWDPYEEVANPIIPRSDWDNLIYKEVVLDFEIDLVTPLVIAPKQYNFSNLIDWYDENFDKSQKERLFSEVSQLAARE